jgi:hypothetical protein
MSLLQGKTPCSECNLVYQAEKVTSLQANAAA